MTKTNKLKSNYKPSFKWGGNTLLWDCETEQKIIQNSQDNNNSKSKSDLEKDAKYGERINYWH